MDIVNDVLSVGRPGQGTQLPGRWRPELRRQPRDPLALEVNGSSPEGWTFDDDPEVEDVARESERFHGPDVLTEKLRRTRRPAIRHRQTPQGRAARTFAVHQQRAAIGRPTEHDVRAGALDQLRLVATVRRQDIDVAVREIRSR